MATERERAEGYREEAQACMDVAERISIKADRKRMVSMAKHWLELAQKAEAKADAGADAS